MAITNVSEARTAANEWLISRLPDRFAAGIPAFDEDLAEWRISIWLSYPGLEPFGPLGELIVGENGTVGKHTPLDEMKDRATRLYEQHRDQIEAPLL